MVRVVVGDYAPPGRLAWQATNAGQSLRHCDPHRAAAAKSAPTTDGTTMTEENLHIACACYQAYVDKDRVALETLIADDFHFTSPLDNRIDRKAYFERCWPTSRTISGFEFVHLAADGDCVFITYEAETTTGRRFRNTEVMTIRNGKIRDVEVFFGWKVPHEAREGGSVERAA